MSGILLLVLRFAMVLVLYGFLAWALWTLWLDMRAQGKWMASYQLPTLHLSWDDGGSARTLELSVPEGIIGRDPASDLQVEDETVSARHARLSYHHAQWWIEDLNSRNGTFVNEQVVAEPVVLTSGDELRCGRMVMHVHIHR